VQLYSTANHHQHNLIISYYLQSSKLTGLETVALQAADAQHRKKNVVAAEMKPYISYLCNTKISNLITNKPTCVFNL
jgi:hypothetical protein